MKNPTALQFKITLQGIRPRIWRRILISANATFWDLHCAIQDAMGWFDSHLHEFKVQTRDGEKHFGIPDPEEDYEDMLPDWQYRVSDYVDRMNPAIEYHYDFGDSWIHQVVLEQTHNTNPHQKLPACIAGEMACPPEDCGGIGGYEDLVQALADPEHERHDELKEWIGSQGFDPSHFDPDEVEFTDADQRLRDLKNDMGIGIREFNA